LFGTRLILASIQSKHVVHSDPSYGLHCSLRHMVAITNAVQSHPVLAVYFRPERSINIICTYKFDLI